MVPSVRGPTATQLRLAVFAAITILALEPTAHAESLPASVRACSQETDSLKRLICYDREVARYTDRPSAAAPSTGPAGRDVPSQAATSAPPQSTSTIPSDKQAQPAPPNDTSGQAGTGSASPPRHIAARIVRVENFPDAIVVHLDNGQVWQQVQEASAAVNLRAGDTVTIDREMAAYWLSGKDGVVVKVRQKTH